MISLVLNLAFTFRAVNNGCIEDINQHDSGSYIKVAYHVMEEGPFYTNIQDADYPDSFKAIAPFLPWVLAILLWVFNGSIIALFVFNSIIASLTIYILYLVIKRLYDLRIANLAALIMCFQDGILRRGPTAGKELWMIFLLVSTLYLYIVFRDKGSIFHLITFAFVSACLMHVDERFLFIPILYAIHYLVFDKRKLKVRIGNTALFILIVITLAVPWVVRNYKVYNELVLISIRTRPLTQLFSSKQTVFGQKNASLPKRPFNFISQAQADSLVKGYEIHDKPILLSEEQIDYMKRGNLPKPSSRIVTMLITVKELWSPFHFRDRWVGGGYLFYPKASVLNNYLRGPIYCLILVPFVLSVLLLRFTKDEYVLLLTVIIILYTAIHMISIPYTNSRYRVSMDAYICIIAMELIRTMYKRLVKKPSLNTER